MIFLAAVKMQKLPVNHLIGNQQIVVFLFYWDPATRNKKIKHFLDNGYELIITKTVLDKAYLRCDVEVAVKMQK